MAKAIGERDINTPIMDVRANGYLLVPAALIVHSSSRAVFCNFISRWFSALGFAGSKGADYEQPMKAKKRSQSGDRDDFRQKSSGKNDTLPTMESNHKYRDGDVVRDTLRKKRDTG